MKSLKISFLVLFILLQSNFISAQVSDTVFPRAVYIDPYWAGYKHHYGTNPQWHQSWDDSSYYYPQLKQMGITHTVTYGDNISLSPIKNSVGVKLLNDNVGDNLYRAAKSVENRYEVGGNNSKFKRPPSIGEEYTDGSDVVYRALVGTHQRGYLLESQSIDQIDQPFGDTYYFIIRAKIVGSGSPNDTVGVLRIWESYPRQQNSLFPTPQQKLTETSEWQPPNFYTIIIRASDFSSYDTYVNVIKWCWLNGRDSNWNFYKTNITLEWFPTRDLYVDYVDVRSNYNHRIFVHPDSSSFLQTAGNYLVNVHNINPNLNWHWYRDEPYDNSFNAFGRMNILAIDRTTTPLNGALWVGGNRFQNFISTVKPNFLMVDHYVIKGDSASSGADNIQLKYDALINNALRPGIIASNNTPQNPIPFWPVIQTSSYKRIIPTYEEYYRDPHNAEILAQAYLSLCYGAKGLMYYAIMTNTPNSLSSGGGIYGLFESEGQVGNNVQDPARVQLTNYRYNAVKKLNQKIDLI